MARLSAEPVVDAMSMFVRGSTRLDFNAVHEVRVMLEAQIAALAAERATAQGIEELRRLTSDLSQAGDDVELASQLDVEFHRTIARTTQNELFLVLLDSTDGVLPNIRRATLVVPNRHPQVIDAIALHDPDAARASMEDHLEQLERAWPAEPPRRS